jgi:hypothetical protein
MWDVGHKVKNQVRQQNRTMRDNNIRSKYRRIEKKAGLYIKKGTKIWDEN